MSHTITDVHRRTEELMREEDMQHTEAHAQALREAEAGTLAHVEPANFEAVKPYATLYLPERLSLRLLRLLGEDPRLGEGDDQYFETLYGARWAVLGVLLYSPQALVLAAEHLATLAAREV